MATTGPGGALRPQGSRGGILGDVAARANVVHGSLVRQLISLSQRRPLLWADYGRQVIKAANGAVWPRW